jgi:hypothetical protein
MIEDNNKAKDNYIISSYLDMEVLPAKFLFPFTLSLTSYYIIQKINDNFMAGWLICFYPLLFFIILQFLQSFYRIIISEFYTDDDISIITGHAVNSKIYLENLDRIVLISNFFKMIISSFSFFSIYYISDYLDFKKDENLIYSIYMIIGGCISSMIYYTLRQMSLFSIKRSINKQDGEKDSESGESPQNTYLSFFSTLTAPLLTYFSNMMIVCSANTGVCTQIYASTIASLLGAFGVTISDFSEYLFPITIILLAVSLFSLYAKKKSLTHKPFMLGVFSCVLILISHFNDKNSLSYLIYPGNILMIGAAIWNARMNKFYGLPKYNK